MAHAGRRSSGMEWRRLSIEDREAQLVSNVCNTVDAVDHLWGQVEGSAVITDIAKERLRRFREQLTGVWNSWKQLVSDLSTLVPRAMKELGLAVQHYLREHPEDGEAVVLIGGQRANHYAKHLVVLYEGQNKERLAQNRLGVGQKLPQPDDAARSLHHIRHTPMKKTGRTTAFNLDQSASTPLHNKATRYPSFIAFPSTPKVRAGPRVLMSKAAPRNHRKSSITTPTSPKTSRRQHN